MNDWEESVKRINQALEEQEKVINIVQSTKMYRAVESVHSMRGRNAAFPSKGKQVAASVKHLSGKMDPRIVKADALTAVKGHGKVIRDNVKYLEESYQIQQKSLEQNISVISKLHEADSSMCVLAPLESIDLPDGYSRRIKNIDALFQDKQIKVYMSKDYGLNEALPKVMEVSEDYISIKYNPQKKEHCAWVTMIAEKIGKVYIHSVYQSLEDIVKSPRVTTFYDFHGVVPEELQFMGHEDIAEQMDAEEKVVITNANYIIVANQAMKRHIMRKYPECKATFILLPMNNEDNDREESTLIKNEKAEKPTVIYAGGLQKWQLIPTMQEAIEKRRNEFDFRMYVSDTSEFLKLWGNKTQPGSWRVDTLSAEELKLEYEKADYGFMLRDDIIVNEVACPTKLIDYIKYGIIPIMKSEKVGDFVENGLGYVRLEDFLEGNMPTEEERTEMVRNNMSVMEKLHTDYENGLADLKKLLYM